LRFVVPVRTISAAPSPKYFGFKRGITWLNAVNDQVAGIGQMGYNLSPRFKDLDDQRFWRATMPGVETGTYGVLEPLARNRVNLKKIETWWPDMLRVAGSLVTNQVRAYDLLRMFGREGHPTPLWQAFAEYGRIAKTEHPIADGRPSRRHLPPSDEPPAHRAGIPPQARPRRVPRQARHHPPGVPRRDGGPGRRARPGPQRHRALERPTTSTQPSPNSAPRATKSGTRTSPGSPRSSTRT
jgi:hypothetical protein